MPKSARPLPHRLSLLLVFVLQACGSPVAEVGINSKAAASDFDADFVIQGEFAGSLPVGAALSASSDSAPSSRVGLQVVAQGNGRFRALLFSGGLPGDGWNGQSALEATSQKTGGTLPFAFSNGPTFTLDSLGRQAIGQDASAQSFTLAKSQRTSPTLLQAPPDGAMVLFDGSSLAGWKGATLDSAGFLIPNGAGSTSGAVTDSAFGDFFLHLEFRTPYLPSATGQARGNSGIYIQNRYELQILDSFGIFPADSMEASRHCGAFWEQRRPAVNMSLPPMSWQTYDIEFTAARFAADGSTRISQARVTIRHNGMLIHDNLALINSTLLGQAESPAPGPHRLQWHGSAVAFRNIWMVKRQATNGLRLQSQARGFSLAISPAHSRMNRTGRFENMDLLGRRLFKLSTQTPRLTAIFPAKH
jgi:hypothetical protein